MNLGVVLVFYLLMALIGLGLAWLCDLNVWVFLESQGLGRALGMGAAVGLAAVGASQLISTMTSWGAKLSERMGALIGAQSPAACLVMALCSGVAEEILFRGFLQQWLTGLSTGLVSETASVWIGIVVSGVIFGGIHIGPEPRAYAPWTLMAMVMGVAFGWLYFATGLLIAPVVAHVVINGVNLTLLSRQQARTPD